MTEKTVLRIFFVLAVLLLVSLACGLPFQTQPEETTQSLESAPAEVEDLPPTSTIPPPPTPTAQPLPPTLVEAEPPTGVDLPLNGVLTFYFDQPMDRGSVEGALRGDHTGEFVGQVDVGKLQGLIVNGYCLCWH